MSNNLVAIITAITSLIAAIGVLLNRIALFRQTAKLDRGHEEARRAHEDIVSAIKNGTEPPSYPPELSDDGNP